MISANCIKMLEQTRMHKPQEAIMNDGAKNINEKIQQLNHMISEYDKLERLYHLRKLHCKKCLDAICELLNSTDFIKEDFNKTSILEKTEGVIFSKE